MSRRNRAEPQCRFRRRLPSQQRAGPDNKARDGPGTEGSNPSPSSGESGANLIFGANPIEGLRRNASPNRRPETGGGLETSNPYFEKSTPVLPDMRPRP